MQFIFKHLLLFLFFLLVFLEFITADGQNGIPQTIKAPHKNVGNNVIDGIGTEKVGFEDIDNATNDWKGYNSFGVHSCTFYISYGCSNWSRAVPFFVVENDPQWAGICNGMAAGVMLAASFDLIQEEQEHGAGTWVVIGILAGVIFILLCKKFLEQYGEVSMLDIKGAAAAKVVLVIGIMTLHSFGEGSGVGVSFAGS